MIKNLSTITTALVITLALAASSHAQLDETHKAHGGLETFQNMGAVEYDMNMEVAGGAVKLSDHQLIDLDSRKTLITSEDYKIGFDGNEAWITPGISAIVVPPRFYSSTPFYFFGLPFLFGDPGVNLEPLGTEEVDGTEYNVVKVTYGGGVGDTPDDNYVVYLDKDTNRVKIVHYIVTYAPLMQGKAVEELERHAAVYDEWQEVSGLLVPEKISFYRWADGKLSPEQDGFMTFENVTFSETNPDPSAFSKPEGAEVDNSHKAQ